MSYLTTGLSSNVIPVGPSSTVCAANMSIPKVTSYLGWIRNGRRIMYFFYMDKLKFILRYFNCNISLG